MRVTIERSSFLKALNHVQSVVERRNTIPILSNVLVQAAKGAVKLTATDLDIEIVESVAADVTREGSATVPAICFMISSANCLMVRNWNWNRGQIQAASPLSRAVRALRYKLCRPKISLIFPAANLAIIFRCSPKI